MLPFFNKALHFFEKMLQFSFLKRCFNFLFLKYCFIFLVWNIISFFFFEILLQFSFFKYCFNFILWNIASIFFWNIASFFFLKYCFIFFFMKRCFILRAFSSFWNCVIIYLYLYLLIYIYNNHVLIIYETVNMNLKHCYNVFYTDSESQNSSVTFSNHVSQNGNTLYVSLKQIRYMFLNQTSHFANNNVPNFLFKKKCSSVLEKFQLMIGSKPKI